MKKQYFYQWNDASNLTGDMPRHRVAYLLFAARSRGAKIVSFPNGYKIGSLYIMQHLTN